MSHRVVLHSLPDAATIGILFALTFTLLIHPPLISSLFKIDEGKVRSRHRLSSSPIFSCLLGNISDVLLDVINIRIIPFSHCIRCQRRARSALPKEDAKRLVDCSYNITRSFCSFARQSAWKSLMKLLVGE